MSKYTATVTLEFEEGVTETEAREYITTAVTAECGCRNPYEDRTHSLIRESVQVRVKRIRGS